MSDAFQLAIVGVGRIVMDAHLAAALALPGVEVAALVDRSAGRIEEARRHFGLAFRGFSDVDAVNVPIDGAIVATPSHTHFAVARSLLERGIPVLVEKPLAEDADEAALLVELARAKGVALGVGYSMRFERNVELARRLVVEEAFGPPESFSCLLGSRGGWSPVDGYVVAGKRTGGVLTVSGAHFIDRIIDWFGYPASFAYRDDGDAGPEANCIADFVFERSAGSVEGRLQLSKTAPMANSFVVRTRDGCMIVPATDETVRFRPHGSTIEHVLTDTAHESEIGANNFERQIEDFVTAVRTRRAPRAGGEAGLAAARLTAALYAARAPLAYPWETVR